MTRITGLLRLCLSALGAALPSSFALAHPGLEHAHGAAVGFAHPFGGLDHFLAMVGLGLWASRLGGRAIWALPLGFMAALALGGVLGMAGVPPPLVEPGILGSLVAVGLAVALARHAGTAAGFGLFHGHAHGAEMPAGASALGHGAGFLAATGLLHAAGVGVGLAARGLNRPSLTRGAGAAIAAAGVVLVLG